MAEHKSEKPTQRRLRKAREKGQVLQAREFVSGVQLLSSLGIVSFWGAHWFHTLQADFRRWLQYAFAGNLDAEHLAAITREIATTAFFPLAVAGAGLLAVTAGSQLALARPSFSMQLLMPKPERLNPLNRLQKLPKENLFNVFYAMALFSVMSLLVFFFAVDQRPSLMRLTRLPVRTGTSELLRSVGDMVWRAAPLFVVIGAIDLFRKYREHSDSLRMTRQEVREEVKESEGRPEVKQRIRTLQRQLLRRRMMSAVPTATAVIVNPTHYAVAIRYDMDSMAAPLVVAKGKNYLALRIRQKALDHEVPLIENPPLARALYQSADVGQEIPPQLYRTVAEVLAYVYEVMDRKLRR